MTSDTANSLARYTTPPPRRMGVQALITRDLAIGMVTRPYLGEERWSLPGGHAPANTPPSLALGHALDTRLGAQAIIGRLLAVDCVPQGTYPEGTVFVYHVELPPQRRARSHEHRRVRRVALDRPR
ncbi:hypothetical protein [Streptomyces sp. NPDC088789]|uniref:hypothetical protein n=1 Tax=Streptomyces sp. NPDC088789 TaxID=3365899 RepID=UPI00382B2BC2